MRRFLVLLVALLIAGAWLGQAMVEDTGYVLLAYKQTSIETSIWVLVIALILLFALVHLSLNLITHVRSPLIRVREWNQARIERKADSKAHLGLIARAEGDWWRARRHFLQAAKTSHVPTIYYLEAAQMAAKSKDEKEAGRILDEAVKTAPDATPAIQLARAEIELQLGHDGKADALIQQLIKQQPNNSQLKALQGRLLANQHDWQTLYPLLSELSKIGALSDKAIQSYRRQAGIALLEMRAQEHAALKPEQLATELRKCWGGLGFETQQDPAVRIQYIDLLLKTGEANEVEQLLSSWLSKDLNETLLLRYSELCGSDANVQLTRAKAWLKQHPSNAALELCLARLSQRAQLWGAAIQHYNRSLELEPHAQTIVELSSLYLQLGEQQKASALVSGYNRPLNLPAPSEQDRQTRKSLV